MTRLLSLLAILLLLGAGCAPSTTTIDTSVDVADPDDLPESDAAWTAHNSIITDGVDEALVGTWVLAEQKVAGVTNPFAGHYLTFSADKTLSHDYSTERTERLPSCTVGGMVAGTFFSELEVDLDVVGDTGDIDPSSGAVSTLLYVTRDRQNPEVECPGSDVVVQSNTPTLPLGTGPLRTGSMGSGVRYTYEMDDDWQTLVVTLDQPSAIYTYKRIQ
ncbi:hypothetical protein HYW18_02925 [Candidatus Uhrbacteria bacterium]|nr:hypothetical protein [Candidatus Uhrbacteria bacterium]